MWEMAVYMDAADDVFGSDNFFGSDKFCVFFSKWALSNLTFIGKWLDTSRLVHV